MDFIKNTLFAFEQCSPQLHLFSWYHALVFFGPLLVFHIIIHRQRMDEHTEFIAKISTVLMATLQIILVM